MDTLLEKKVPLTKKEKDLFGYFGTDAKIAPPFRILNPQNIYIGDKTSIREGAFIHAYKDLSYLIKYISPRYKNDFRKKDYYYNSQIHFNREIQIGRFVLISCTKSIIIENNVLVSERVFIGDNNHTFSHPHVPIMQQPNKQGKEILIGKGSWIGIGACILEGTVLGQNSVVGANAVVKGKFPPWSVISSAKAKLIYCRHR